MPPPPGPKQFTNEQRVFLALEYHRLKGTQDFITTIKDGFAQKFPGVKIPDATTIRRVYKKFDRHGTVLNLNSAASPGLTHSGRLRTVRVPAIIDQVRRNCEEDCQKPYDDPTVRWGLSWGLSKYPVICLSFLHRSSRRNDVPGLKKSSFLRIIKDLKFHPFKIKRCHEMQAGDAQARLDFARAYLALTDAERDNIAFSDEAGFMMGGSVNTQNVRRFVWNTQFVGEIMIYDCFVALLLLRDNWHTSFGALCILWTSSNS